MRIIFVVGPTGGHFFPALQLAKFLRENFPQVEVKFMGPLKKYLVEILKKEDFPFYALPLWSKEKGKFKFGVGLFFSFLLSLILFLLLRPQKVMVMGSYGSLPGGLAAYILRIPLYVHEQNVIPGRTNLFLSRLSQKIFLSFPETGSYFEGEKAVYAGMMVNSFPLKRENSSLPTLLILGGSQGSEFMNEKVSRILCQIRPQGWRILHLTGEKDYLKVKRIYDKWKIKAEVFPFQYPMDRLYSQATLSLTRGGAVTLSELYMWNIPSVVIPLKTRDSYHQKENALWFQKKGGFWIVEEHQIVRLKRLLITLLSRPPSVENLSPRVTPGISPEEIICKEMGLRRK